MNEFPGVMVFDRKLISSDEYAVRCVNCSAMGAPAQSIEWAAANWNRRVEKYSEYRFCVVWTFLQYRYYFILRYFIYQSKTS